MDNTISTLLKMFESFFKRAILPSIMLLAFLYILQTYNAKIDILPTIENKNYLLLFMISITLSFIMSILTQSIFDNNLKNNFNGKFFYISENNILKLLREKVIDKFTKENSVFKDIEYNDYFLYQVIGRELAFIKPETKTTRYMDEIKSAGIVFLSIVITIFIVMITYHSFITIIIELFIITLVIIFSFDYIKSKYRSRAIRIYVNYLIGDKSW